MKQFLVLDQNLKKKDIVETYVVPNVFDCIVPQKTTLDFKLGVNVAENDIVVIRDAVTLAEEYLGIIETKEVDKVVSLLVVPFISIADNELKLGVLDGEKDVQTFIFEQFNNNFVNTDDMLMKYNFHFRDFTNEQVKYKAVSQTSNLMELLNEIYLNTGIYVDFSLKYENGMPSGIYCDLHNANEEEVKKIRFDNPQIVGKVDYKFSQYGNYNKATIQVGENKNKVYYFYLREDNKLTTNPQDPLRLKKVKNKNLTLSAEYTSEQQLAEALVLLAESELKGDAFAYSIQFNVLRNAINDWRYRQRCDFRAEDKLYESYITNIEYLNDKEARVTLGAYRYTLTDKIKMLMRPKEVIGGTFNGIAISTALGKDIYWFTQEDGNLVLNYTGENPPNFSINENGELIYEYDENVQSAPNFEILNKDLTYKY